MGKDIALEILEWFRQEVRKGTRDANRARYRVHWKDVEVFATRDILHLGLTLHQLLEECHLTIEIGELNDMGSEATLDVLGISRSADCLNKFVHALELLLKEKPRPVTFLLKDEVRATPTNMEHVLRKLSIPFHRLHQRGFEMGVILDNSKVKPRSSVSSSVYVRTYDGLGEWHLGDDGWGTLDGRAASVWNWTLRDWGMHFTRGNEMFKPSCEMSDRFHPNPNGPVDIYFEYFQGGFRKKIELWEGIRRYLYRSFPDTATAVVLVKGGDDEWYVDCGCPTGKHTCSDYFLCWKHGGWDQGCTRWNNYCYKCLGYGASEQAEE